MSLETVYYLNFIETNENLLSYVIFLAEISFIRAGTLYLAIEYPRIDSLV
jgi:hypothetical protein